MQATHRTAPLALFAAIISAGLFLLAACGGGATSETAKPTAGASTVNITLKEWALSPDKTSAPAGNVTFKATNDGAVRHELVVLKTDLAPDALQLSGSTVDEEGSGKVIDEIAEFEPGSTRELTLNLEPGSYVIFCNVPGHYLNGVRGAFTVTAASIGTNY